MYHPPGPHWHTECWTSLPLAVGAFFWWMVAYLMPHKSVSFLAASLHKLLYTYQGIDQLLCSPIITKLKIIKRERESEQASKHGSLVEYCQLLVQCIYKYLLFFFYGENVKFQLVQQNNNSAIS